MESTLLVNSQVYIHSVIFLTGYAEVRAVDEIEARIASGKARIRDWAEFEAELDALQD